MTTAPFPYNYICIEGNIGAGKTSFCEQLKAEYDCKIILEEFDDNPFLPLFYKEPDRFAFTVELFFMTERFKQLQKIATQHGVICSEQYAHMTVDQFKAATNKPIYRQYLNPASNGSNSQNRLCAAKQIDAVAAVVNGQSLAECVAKAKQAGKNFFWGHHGVHTVGDVCTARGCTTSGGNLRKTWTIYCHWELSSREVRWS